VLPNLRGFVDAEFCGQEEAEARLDEVGAIFVALPHNQSQDVIPKLAEASPETLIIDMAGDFRTNDPEGYAEFYGREHGAPELLSSFIYGLSEFQRDALASAKLVANPGCFATCMLLALAPIAKAGRLHGDFCVTGITGSTGSGNKPIATTHHPERFSNVRAYKPLTHQHILEVTSILSTLGGGDFEIQFVPQSGPFSRGIFSTIFTPDIGKADLAEIYDDAYLDEELIHVVDGSPNLRWVQGNPRSFVGIAGDDESGVAFSVIDNLGKGAASQGIQNLNIAMGWRETDGLRIPGGFV